MVLFTLTLSIYCTSHPFLISNRFLAFLPFQFPSFFVNTNSPFSPPSFLLFSLFLSTSLVSFPWFLFCLHSPFPSFLISLSLFNFSFFFSWILLQFTSSFSLSLFIPCLPPFPFSFLSSFPYFPPNSLSLILSLFTTPFPFPRLPSPNPFQSPPFPFTCPFLAYLPFPFSYPFHVNV